MIRTTNTQQTKKETHTVAFSNFLENNKIQLFYLYCVNRVVYHMNLAHLNSMHVL